jgi:hypothetical protein
MATHYSEISGPKYSSRNTKKWRGAFAPVALLTRDANTELIRVLDREGIDTKTWMMPLRGDLPEDQFVLYKTEVPFEQEERAVRILSNIIAPGSGDR